MRHLRHPGLDMDMKIDATIGILMIIGLSLAIGFGFYQTYDGKNLPAFAEIHKGLREDLAAARAAASVADEKARKDRERLAHYIEYVLGKLEEP